MATPMRGAKPRAENTPYGRFWIGKSEAGSTGMKERSFGSLGLDKAFLQSRRGHGPASTLSSRRRPGPITRNLSAAFGGRQSSREHALVVIGPGLRRDDVEQGRSRRKSHASLTAWSDRTASPGPSSNPRSHPAAS